MIIPTPPAYIYKQHGAWTMPATGIGDFVLQTILNPDSELYNPEHNHLMDANILWLWTTADNSRQGKVVLGTAEIPMFRCGKWQKARQEQQIMEWTGDIIMPDFIITINAGWFNESSNPQRLALIEHEMYHCAQKKDQFGMPKFNKQTGRPSFTIQSHDVEEFVGVVRRYGADASNVRDMVRAANKGPEIARADIDGICGACSKKIA